MSEKEKEIQEDKEKNKERDNSMNKNNSNNNINIINDENQEKNNIITNEENKKEINNSHESFSSPKSSYGNTYPSPFLQKTQGQNLIIQIQKNQIIVPVRNPFQNQNLVPIPIPVLTPTIVTKVTITDQEIFPKYSLLD